MMDILIVRRRGKFIIRRRILSGLLKERAKLR